MYEDLKGKVGVITGSSSGIGAAIAERFANEGMKVVINYMGNEGEAQQIVEKLKGEGNEAIAVGADVKNEKDISYLLKCTLENFGDLDVWVNNAGVQKPFISHELPLEEWQKVIDIGLTGVFLGAREALNYFLGRKKRGTIINISSVHDRIPRPWYAHYAASKGGVKQLTRTLAMEYAENGIRVNAIGPGAIETPILDDDTSENEDFQESRPIPVGYMGSPEDVANVAAWLSSKESNYVTGVTIYVDGGLLLYPY